MMPFVTDGDVGVPLPRHGLRHVLVRVPVPVVDADLVRAVVRAVPRPDAPVVDLRVHAFRRVVGRVDRAHRLTRRVAAVLTEHGQEAHVEVARVRRVDMPSIVPLDAHPAHVAAHDDLILAHPRNVVLRVAGDDTGAAARCTCRDRSPCPSAASRARPRRGRGPRPGAGTPSARPSSAGTGWTPPYPCSSWSSRWCGSSWCSSSAWPRSVNMTAGAIGRLL